MKRNQMEILEPKNTIFKIFTKQAQQQTGGKTEESMNFKIVTEKLSNLKCR